MATTISTRVTVLLFIGTSLLGVVIGACSGSDGAAGPAGPAGAQGVPGQAGQAGPQGPAGPQGTSSGDTDGGGFPFGKACTTPCHTLNGVVDQWRLSGHSHPQENEIGGGACGNCHAIDGIQNRVAGKAVTTADAGPAPNVDKGHLEYKTGTGVGEIAYAGASTIGKIHCTTCHAFDDKNDPHIVGGYTPHAAPIRVPGGASDTVYVETSPTGSTTPVGTPLTLATANLCVFCHKSRKDVTLYIGASNNLSQRWGPHEGPQADVFTGKGGYPLTLGTETYGTATHSTIASACVSCHMQPVANNSNTPDHTMKPQVTYCKTCHATFQGNNFDINGGRALVTDGLKELEAELNAKGLLYRSDPAGLTPDELADGQFHLDTPRTKAAVDAKTAGAVYNYLIVARGRDLGVHNPIYTRQLLFDSIRWIKTNGAVVGVPQFLPSRPTL